MGQCVISAHSLTYFENTEVRIVEATPAAARVLSGSVSIYTSSHVQ